MVGYDRRYQGELFAEAVAEVLAGNGLRVYLTHGPHPDAGDFLFRRRQGSGSCSQRDGFS